MQPPPPPQQCRSGMSIWSDERDGDIGVSFARHSRLDQASESLNARKLLVEIVHAWTVRQKDGVILRSSMATNNNRSSSSSSRFLAIEFFEMLKESNASQSQSPLPGIEVEFVRTASLRQADLFLRGEEFEVLVCSDPSLFDAVAVHLARYSTTSRNMIDALSGSLIHDCIIVPMPVAGRDAAVRGTRTPLVMVKGWTAVLGCTYQGLALFRITLGLLLTIELSLRFRFLHPFYSDQGTLPLHLLMDRVDDIYKLVCFLHCRFGEVWQQQVLLSLQVVFALCFTLGVQTRWSAVASWYLYLSLTLRNTWMSYILDRYFHYLLFLAMFLPLDRCWSVTASTTFRNEKKPPLSGWFLSPATIAMKLLVLWIYWDAGYGKYADPLQGWSYGADPLPALDTYARHTLPAQYLYALLGPAGLRLLTPVVVYVELLAAPVALVGAYFGNRTVTYAAVALICGLHLGICMTLRNAALLSLVACTAWCTFLPIGGTMAMTTAAANGGGAWAAAGRPGRRGALVSLFFIGSMVAGSVWLETISQACDQSVKHIWSTLLHNRWNVFVGAEEYVTWEIAPGLLRDGSYVDVWGRRDTIDWSLPGGGAPCTATARPGRWRSFPYLAGLEGEEGDALWGYLCDEWDREHRVDRNPGRQLIKYNFFMLQADVLPEMHFSPTRKRLVISYDCVPAVETPLVALEDAVPEAQPIAMQAPEVEGAEDYFADDSSSSLEPEFPKASVPETAEPELFEREHNEPVDDRIGGEL